MAFTADPQTQAGINLIPLVDAAWNAGWRGDDLIEAVAVAGAESSGKADAVNYNNNGSVDYGGWQVNSIHGPDLDQVYDLGYNARLAHGIWAEAGNSFRPWVAWRKGKHEGWRARAQAAVSQFEQTLPEGRAAFAQQQRAADPRQAFGGAMKALIAGQKQFAGTGAKPGGETDLGETPDDGTGMADEGGILDDLNSLIATLAPPPEAIEASWQAAVQQATTTTTTTGEGWQGIPALTDAQVSEWASKGLRTNAARGAAVARAFGFNGTVHGVGARGNKSDHPDGNATDFMVGDDREMGNTIASYFVSNRDALGVKYVIFYDQIASASNGWEWRPYRHPAGRTDDTAQHRDHPHVSYY